MHSGVFLVQGRLSNDVKDISRAILDNLPLVDFNIEDILVEEGITKLYREGTSYVGA